MGMRSSLYKCEISVQDWDRFFSVINLFYDINKFPEGIKKYIPEKSIYDKKIEEIKKQIEVQLVTRQVCCSERMYRENNFILNKYLFENIKPIDDDENYYDNEGPIWFDWDNWKIQGYWYDDFCDFLDLLWFAGVRGEVHLDFETGQSYIIYFNEDKVIAEIFGDPEYNEEGDIINEDKLDNSVEFDLSQLNQGQQYIFSNLKW